MRGLLFLLSTEHRMVRNAFLLACGLGLLTYTGAQGALSLATAYSESSRATEQARQAKETTRVYTVTRSVLDDNVTTGSVSKAVSEVRLDPCKK